MLIPTKNASSLMEKPKFQLTLGEEDYLKASGVRVDQLYILKQIKMEGVNFAFGEKALQSN